MPEQKSIDPKFTWGDLVQIANEAPSHFRSGEFGSVYGMTERKSQIIYDVEFGDGASVEVPEEYLKGAKV